MQPKEKIIQHLIAADQGKMWDVRSGFLKRSYHDEFVCLLGVLKRKLEALNYIHLNGLSTIFEIKNIQVIGTPKTIGQAEITGSLVKI
jgi:hypothetical protein